MIYWLFKTVLNMHIFWYSYYHLYIYIVYTYECLYVCVDRWMDGTHTVHFHQGT